jgi:uncharacterized protein (TIGR03083 family)
MDSDTVWRAIDEQRTRVADLLEGLSGQEWSTPSLCDGWTVRDVAAHLTLAQMRPLAAVWGLIRARGSFDGMIRETAYRQARLPVEAYSALLRGMVGSRRKAPGVTELEPLIDVLVHTQDIARPLGRTYPMPAPPAAAAADRVWSMGYPFRARRRFAGFAFTATDANWRAGAGPRVEGPIGVILLTLTGRTAALAELTGPGAADLRSRLRGPAVGSNGAPAGQGRP